VASSVLHNVGNVLNSVNVSSSLIADTMRDSKISNLAKALAMLHEHENDLGNFLDTNPKGKQLLGYLDSLAAHLTQLEQDVLREIGSLTSNIAHIKEIVSMQQSYAKISGLKESVKVGDLVEDALRMNNAAMSRHKVTVVREYSDTPPIEVEKHKVLQILVNLIRNAKHACDDSGRNDKQMILRVACEDRLIKISVIDNGVGIKAENLTRIFNHGFTTRKEGHGFGLHSGAMAAREIGGTLTASSEGENRGANFTLAIPVP
jgi:C4-dicarboxylate-specific signal transduction histidine kinase